MDKKKEPHSVRSLENDYSRSLYSFLPEGENFLLPTPNSNRDHENYMKGPL